MKVIPDCKGINLYKETELVPNIKSIVLNVSSLSVLKLRFLDFKLMD
jgi:hypothetical protein